MSYHWYLYVGTILDSISGYHTSHQSISNRCQYLSRVNIRLCCLASLGVCVHNTMRLPKKDCCLNTWLQDTTAHRTPLSSFEPNNCTWYGAKQLYCTAKQLLPDLSIIVLQLMSGDYNIAWQLLVCHCYSFGLRLRL